MGKIFFSFHELQFYFRIHSLKSAISSMLGAVGDGGEVTAEHVAIFKRKLEADIEERKKRRRLDA